MKTIKTNKTSPVFRRLCADIKPDQWQGQRVLDCADGPGSLSAELRGCGVDVTAVDPLDALGAAELRQRALAATTSSPDIRPDFDLAACRQEHIEALQAFERDRREHPDRYAAASLPQLAFDDHSFDLIVCGHLLFSDTERVQLLP